MKKGILNIACSTDRNYAPLCGVMLCSLLENNKENTIHIHILEHGIDTEIADRFIRQANRYGATCSFHDVDESKLEGCKFRTKVHQLSKAAYYRILLASILTDIETVLYLDCDMIVRKSLRSIFSYDLNNYPIAAVRDYDQVYNSKHFEQMNFSEGDEYFNSGCLLINLRYWRENDSETELLAFAKMEREVFFHDQDALNYVFRGNWLRLPPSWNRYNVFNIHCKGLFDNDKEIYDFWDDPFIVHFPGKLFKPWFNSCFIPFKHEWDYYMGISEWREFKYLKNPNPLFAFIKTIYTKMKFYILSRTGRYLKK